MRVVDGRLSVRETREASRADAFYLLYFFTTHVHLLFPAKHPSRATLRSSSALRSFLVQTLGGGGNGGAEDVELESVSIGATNRGDGGEEKRTGDEPFEGGFIVVAKRRRVRVLGVDAESIDDDDTNFASRARRWNRDANGELAASRVCRGDGALETVERRQRETRDVRSVGRHRRLGVIERTSIDDLVRDVHARAAHDAVVALVEHDAEGIVTARRGLAAKKPSGESASLAP